MPTLRTLSMVVTLGLATLFTASPAVWPRTVRAMRPTTLRC